MRGEIYKRKISSYLQMGVFIFDSNHGGEVH